MDALPLLLTQAAAARLIGIERKTIYKMVEAGIIPTVRLNRRRYIAVRDIEALIEERREYAALEEIAV